MINRTSSLIITLLIISTLVFFIIKNDHNSKMNSFSCTGGYNLYDHSYSLKSTITIAIANNKGKISLLGDYYINGIKQAPVRIASNFSIQRSGNIYSVKNFSSQVNPVSLLSDAGFMNMMNMSIFKNGMISVYNIYRQKNGDYIFLNASNPLFSCYASTR